MQIGAAVLGSGADNNTFAAHVFIALMCAFKARLLPWCLQWRN